MKLKTKISDFMLNYSVGVATSYNGMHFLKGSIRNVQVLDGREYVINADKKVAYLSNLKVACSSIKAAMTECDSQDNYEVHNLVFQLGQSRKDRLTSTEKTFF